VTVTPRRRAGHACCQTRRAWQKPHHSRLKVLRGSAVSGREKCSPAVKATETRKEANTIHAEMRRCQQHTDWSGVDLSQPNNLYQEILKWRRGKRRVPSFSFEPVQIWKIQVVIVLKCGPLSSWASCTIVFTPVLSTHCSWKFV